MRNKVARTVCQALVVAALISLTCSPTLAAVSNLAADYSNTTNPNGVWAYGYLSSNSSTQQSADNLAFLENGTTPGGFVAYNTFTGSGSQRGWTTGLGFPFAGVWDVPPSPVVYTPSGGPLTDWPSAAGDNPNYPNGILGGHSPNTSFASGWYAVKYTAPTSGPVDVEMKSWQVAVYPDVPPNPSFGGATRGQQVRIDKLVGSTRTNLVRSTNVTRHGVDNVTGTPEYTGADAEDPGVSGTYPTQEDEINHALRSSAHPNLFRVTNLNLNAGESIVISYAAQQGLNFAGFHGLNVIIRSGADRIATTRWDLSDDWNVTGATATGLGPDAAWSYGILKNGSFAPYDRIKTGFASENVNTPERESHGWGTQEPGWFVNGVPDPEEGPIVPGMMKDGDGFNMTTIVTGGQFTGTNGDWSGGKVALHTPPSTVDASQTSVIRWTAPQNMTVKADGDMWRLTLPDDADRRHHYELRKGAAVLASGTINELGFGATDSNSANPESFSVNGIAVTTGDILELRISPLSSGGVVTADFDGSGTVDGADLEQWRGDFPGPGSDANGDGKSDGADFLAWQRELSNSGGASASPSFIGVDFTVEATAGAGVVPEPASILLALLASQTLVHLRRCR